LGAQFLGAGVICASFALSAYADLATIALATVIGLLGWAGYTATATVGAGEVLANAVGALAAAFFATLLIRRSSIPGFALVSAAILQLVGTSPGSGNLAEGIATLFLAASIALGIAAGATLGTYLGRPIVGQLRRIRRRYAGTDDR
jgi:uncharacterized membrane protein YjjB (DUF3815 family)